MNSIEKTSKHPKGKKKVKRKEEELKRAFNSHLLTFVSSKKKASQHSLCDLSTEQSFKLFSSNQEAVSQHIQELLSSTSLSFKEFHLFEL